MVYDVTDNRKKINGFFFEQSKDGNIHIYNSKMEYIDIIDNIGVFPYDVFIDKCKQWLNENN